MQYNKDACCYGNMAYPEMTMPEKHEMDYRECGCGCQPQMCGCPVAPIVEPPIERCCHQQFVHEVPHVCPINTRIINHHIYKHTYSPHYTCCEENVISNVNLGSCCQF